MRVKESFWHEASKADKNDKADWKRDARRQSPIEQASDAAASSKSRQSDSPLKDELKFANLLESPAKAQKPNQQHEDSGEERRDDQKKEKMRAGGEKDSADNLAGDGKTGRYDSSGGQTGGGGAQSGFGMSGNVNQLNLSENFAARSILHIADLERLVSTIRTQVGLGGRREIVLRLKRSVLEGLQVKIVTDQAAGVQIEFLAANEKVRSEIEKHSGELAQILRGRGINLETLKTIVDDGSSQNGDFSKDVINIGVAPSFDSSQLNENDLLSDNTFGQTSNEDGGGTIYNA